MASPSLTRVSTNHPSLATTVQGEGSNLISPAGSAASSGTLSPLGARSQTAAVAKTFQQILQMRQRRTIPLSQSAFPAWDLLTPDSLQYQKFQAAVERIKRVPPMERDEKKASGFFSKSPLSLRKPSFVEWSHEVYFKKFPSKVKVKDGEELPLFNVDVEQSGKTGYNRPITAFEMQDSIAVFCLCDQEAVLHHFSSATKRILDVVERLSLFPRKENAQYKIYMVGGDGSPDSTQLLHNIESGLLIYFGHSGKIVETFLNKAAPSTYISVALTPKKKFFFCRHD